MRNPATGLAAEAYFLGHAYVRVTLVVVSPLPLASSITSECSHCVRYQPFPDVLSGGPLENERSDQRRSYTFILTSGSGRVLSDWP